MNIGLDAGSNGSLVGRLHGVLTRAGLAIDAQEMSATTFGASTVQALKAFQASHQLQVTGAIDLATLTVLLRAEQSQLHPGGDPSSGRGSQTHGGDGASGSYSVHGTVTSPDRAGVGGLRVQIVDKNIGADTTLVEATTDGGGNYHATFGVAAVRALGKTSPDLQARVLSKETFLGASDIHYNATLNETLNVSLPANLAALPSEYESLIAAISSQYRGALGNLVENDTRQDITYLANKTRWDGRAVALAVLADQFSRISATPPPSNVATTNVAATNVAATNVAAPAPAATAVSLQAEFYYALFRAGVPANADALFQASATTVGNVWQRAIADGVIPRALASAVPAAVTTFQTLSAAHILGAPPPVGPSTLTELLAAAGVTDASQQQRFATLYVQQRDTPATLWTAVASALGAATAQRLQLAGQLFYLTLNNAPLVTALNAAEKASPLTATVDLAMRGYYDPAKWIPLTGNSIPAGIPGADVAAQQANYAALLAAQVRLAFPSVVLADQVARGVMPTSDTPAVATAVHDFLIANQGNFEIGLEPVEAFIARTKLAGTAPAVVTQIKRLQRVYQLTPDDQSMAVLLTNGLDSAWAITRYDAAEFTSSFAAQLGGSDVADAIHVRAKQVFSAVLNVTVNYLGARSAPSLNSNNPVLIPYWPPIPFPDPTYPVVAYPTLESLFGSLDYCDCPDCRSILSPAAYLVDLLHFVDKPSVSPNPLDVLLGRRPDLQYLPLTCENTNTALPYIDVVNETLEYFVANNPPALSLANYQGHDTGSTVTSAELLACPQYVNDTAYTLLQGRVFPPPLPYNRPLALLRLHLQALGVALPDVMAALRASDAVERQSPDQYGWRDILLEQLGISRDEYQIFTFTDPTLALQRLYGYDGADPLTFLRGMTLQTFSRRTGVSYEDLYSILQTTFINPGAVLLPRLQQLATTFTALAALKTNPSSAAAFIAGLPAGLDATQYGGANLTDYNAVVAWVTDPTNFARIMGLIVITDPSGGPDQCSGASLQFRYANPDPTANLLSATDFTKLMLFIRLWQKLGLTIDQTDDVLAALYPAADLPTGTNDAVNLPLLATGFQTFLPRLGFLMRVMSTLGLGANDALAQLLACWAPIDTTGDDSLYASMFLTPTLVQQDGAFSSNAYGVLFSNASETLMLHQATLCAAFNLTGAEFVLITNALNYDATTLLNLANISAIYRIGWLAHTLGISVVEFLLVRQLSGLDPFAPLDPATTPPAEPPAVRFIALLRALSAGGLPPVQALYLIWNQDISGKLAPPASAITGLARTLRADFAAVDAQFALVDDPDGKVAQSLMTLVYGATASDFFFGLLNNTLVTSVAYGNPQPTLAQPILDASTGRLSYDDLRKQLSFAGVLDATAQAAIDLAVTNNGNYAPLHAALASLATANQQAVGPFFAAYKELLPLYQAYVASTDPLQTRRTTLLANFLPTLTQKRKREQALSDATAVVGGDPKFASALLQFAAVLHAAADPTQPACNDLTAIETQGLKAQFFLTNDPTAKADQTVDAAANLSYAPNLTPPNPLPAGSGGGAIAGTWSGFLDVPQDGYYNLSIATDAGAAVKSLTIGGATVTLAQAANVWSNTSPIVLTAGALTSIALTVTSLKSTLTVSWESIGLGWQVIPAQYLYSASLVDRLGTSYTRLFKAVTLASALSLDANEIAWLGTASSFAVETTAKDTVAAGTVTLTPASMDNITAGSVLMIDSGAAQESVTVSAFTATTFTAVTTHAHDGSVTPFAIVSQAAVQIGQGWLNFLAVDQQPLAADAASLGSVLAALLDFARIKAAVSPSDERLLSVLEDPAAVLPTGGQSSGASQSALLALTGWAQDSVDALLTRFFGNTQPSHLSSVENFRRVFDAYTFIKSCRLTATALLAATINAPNAMAVTGLQSALRALYAESDWLTVVKPINDAMRVQQRDALVAYILQQMGDAYANLTVTQATNADTQTGATQVSLASTSRVQQGMAVGGVNIAPGATVVSVVGNTVTLSVGVVAELPSGALLTFVPAGALAIDTADKLYEYFLIDVETQPPVETSRIRIALSAVQLFIERVLRNLEPQVAPTSLDASLWTWMKRYRVWQANREVFLWPENWLYPELRDDQSPFFQQMMSTLLQSDITDDTAASAYLDYLTSLELVAKLEPCGIYHVGATGNSSEISYVVARTAGAHRKYYFRTLSNGSWSPWTEVKIECEDMPITPIVWNGKYGPRLFLFWLKIVKQTSAVQAPTFSTSANQISNWQLTDLQGYSQAADTSQSQGGSVMVSAVLNWTEYYNGQWQPTKTSEINRPTFISSFPQDGPTSFDPDRNLYQICPVQWTNDPPPIPLPNADPPLDIPADVLVLAITAPTFIEGTPGFILYNTHSLPVRLEDIGPFPTAYFVSPPTYRSLMPNTSYNGGPTTGTFNINYVGNTLNYTNSLFDFTRGPRSVDVQPGLADPWDAPFFYEDRRYVFYVTTSEDFVPLRKFAGFGVQNVKQYLPSAAQLVLPKPADGKPAPIAIAPLANALNRPTGPAAVEAFLAKDGAIRAGLGTSAAVSFQGRRIYPSGSLPSSSPPTSPSPPPPPSPSPPPPPPASAASNASNPTKGK